MIAAPNTRAPPSGTRQSRNHEPTCTARRGERLWGDRPAGKHTGDAVPANTSIGSLTNGVRRVDSEDGVCAP